MLECALYCHTLAWLDHEKIFDINEEGNSNKISVHKSSIFDYQTNKKTAAFVNISMFIYTIFGAL